jgi:broad specificity phosphatase PhoE
VAVLGRERLFIATLGTVPTPPTRLLVVRHGESEWNALGKWQGRSDPPLSERGRRQAVAACSLLGSFDALWASDLQRAALTAEIIGEELGLGPVQFDARLQETGVGQWEGLTLDEIEAGWPGYLAQHLRPDGAEPIEQVVDRVTAVFRSIAEVTPVGEVLVVTHAGVLRTMRRALGVTDERFGNLTGCWFYVAANGTVTAEYPVALIDPTEPVTDAL